MADRSAVKCIQARLPSHGRAWAPSRWRRAADPFSLSLDKHSAADLALGRRASATLDPWLIIVNGSALAEDNIVLFVLAVAPFRGISAATGVDVVSLPLESVADVDVAVAITPLAAILLLEEAVAVPAIAAVAALGTAQFRNRRPKGHDVGDKAGSGVGCEWAAVQSEKLMRRKRVFRRKRFWCEDLPGLVRVISTKGGGNSGCRGRTQDLDREPRVQDIGPMTTVEPLKQQGCLCRPLEREPSTAPSHSRHTN